MTILHIEKLGGLAGFGGSKSHIRSRGQLDTAELSPDDKKAVDSLFQTGGKTNPSEGGDGFRFRISRTTDARTETVEASDEHVPAALAACVKDELV